MSNIYKTPLSELIDASDDMDRHHREIINFIKNNCKDFNTIMDIGERNPLTEKMERAFEKHIDNTIGDLDTVEFSTGVRFKKYDLIVCSHVIEHLMNPLLCLRTIEKRFLKNDGELVIAYPTRFIKFHRHFHEIPPIDMINLIDKAGYELLKWESYKCNHPFPFGIRPVLRIIYDRNHILLLRKKL